MPRAAEEDAPPEGGEEEPEWRSSFSSLTSFFLGVCASGPEEEEEEEELWVLHAGMMRPNSGFILLLLNGTASLVRDFSTSRFLLRSAAPSAAAAEQQTSKVAAKKFSSFQTKDKKTRRCSAARRGSTLATPPFVCLGFVHTRRDTQSVTPLHPVGRRRPQSAVCARSGDGGGCAPRTF